MDKKTKKLTKANIKANLISHIQKNICGIKINAASMLASIKDIS